MIKIRILFFLMLLWLCGCGAEYHFKLAKLYESKSFLAQANHHYQAIIDRHPDRAPEAMFYMGENFRRDDAQKQATLEHFRSEFAYLAALKHPNLVSVHHFGRDAEGHTYFTMDYVDGASFREALSGASWEEAYDLLVQACRVLSYLHNRARIPYIIQCFQEGNGRAHRVEHHVGAIAVQ